VSDLIILNTVDRIFKSMYSNPDFINKKAYYSKFATLLKDLFINFLSDNTGNTNTTNTNTSFSNITTNFSIIFLIQNIFPDIFKLVQGISQTEKTYIKQTLFSYLEDTGKKQVNLNTNKKLEYNNIFNTDISIDSNFTRLKFIFDLISEIDNSFTVTLVDKYIKTLDQYS